MLVAWPGWPTLPVYPGLILRLRPSRSPLVPDPEPGLKLPSPTAAGRPALTLATSLILGVPAAGPNVVLASTG